MVHHVRIHRGTLLAQALVLSAIAALASCGSSNDFVAAPGTDASAGGAAPEAGTGGTQEAGPDGKAGQGGAEQGGSAGQAGADGGQDAIEEPGATTVQGTVVDPYLQPVSGVKVRIGTVEATTQSDGTFAIDIAKGAYDVLLLAQEGGKTYGSRFAHLTRLDPVLQMSALPARVAQTAKVSGTITWPAGVNRDGLVFCDFASAAPGGPNSLSIFFDNYTDLSAKWYGPSPAEVTMKSLTWTKQVGGLPDHYTGYSTSTMSLGSAGGTWNAAPVADGLTDGTLATTITAGNTFKVNAKAVFVRSLQGPVAPRIINDGSATWATTYSVPSHNDLTLSYCGSIRPAASFNPFTNFSVVCKTGLPAGASVTVAPEAPPSLTAPTPGQTGVNLMTNFTWAPFKNGVYVLLIYSDSLWLTVATSDTSVTLPDLQAMGAPLPGQTSFTFVVYAFAPYASIDEIAGPPGFMEPTTSYADARAPAADAIAAISEAQTFKTQ